MAELKDLWLKIAKNEQLTPSELDDLGRFGTETQQRNSFVAGNTTAANELDVDISYLRIYNEVLTNDKTSLDIEIPENTRVLQIFTTGRTTDTGSGPAQLRMVVNNDVASNYDYQYLQAASTTITSGQVLASNIGLDMGLFLNDDRPDGEVCSNICTIIHPSGPFFKVSTCLTNYRNTSFRFVKQTSSFWNSTDPISTVNLSLSAGDMKIGSLISIYGIR